VRYTPCMALTLGARPERFPLFPKPEPARRGLPILQDVRAVDQQSAPLVTVWEITLACDLRCRHCGSRAGPRRPEELTTEEALDVVAQLKDLGGREVALIGGEAYLRPDWTTIIRAITDAGMRATMTTGGRALTPERARAAKDAGLYSASISVDGLEATHDALRNVPGSFASALEAMRNLQAVGIPTACNSQINRLTLRQLDDLADVLLNHGMRGWQIQLTVAMGRAADEENLLLEPFQMLEAMPLVMRLFERCATRKVPVWAGNNIGYFGPYEGRLRSYLPQGHRGSCGAGRTTLGIEANGGVKGCPSLATDEFTGGNLRDARLKDIWQRTAPLRFMRDMTVDKLWGFCGTCYYADACKAGCNWTSHSLLGRTGNNPYCHHRALELLRQGKRERIRRLRHATGQPFDHGEFEILLEDWREDQRARAEQVAAGTERWLDVPGGTVTV
jgi:radical SAM protein with 4Fe4S-binding SPASM domain